MKSKRLEAIWDEIRSELQRRKTRLYDEIRTYPTPITACDKQFDHLLTQQRLISRELERTDEAARASLLNGAPAVSIDAFIRLSPWISDEAKQRLCLLLKQEPGREVID